jgi:hypothetical protein
MSNRCNRARGNGRACVVQTEAKVSANGARSAQGRLPVGCSGSAGERAERRPRGSDELAGDGVECVKMRLSYVVRCAT